MNNDIVVLLYYACFLLMSSWVVNIYGKAMLKALRESDANPLPQEFMEKYTEENHNMTSEEGETKSSSDIEGDNEAKEVEWGGEEGAAAVAAAANQEHED